MTYAQWSQTVARKAERKARKAQRGTGWLARVAKAVAKEAGLLVVMMAVTTVVVAVESGSLHKGMHVAAIAGPLKAAAAAAYGRIFG